MPSCDWWVLLTEKLRVGTSVDAPFACCRQEEAGFDIWGQDEQAGDKGAGQCDCRLAAHRIRMDVAVVSFRSYGPANTALLTG